MLSFFFFLVPLVSSRRTKDVTGILTGQGYLAGSESLRSGALEGRERQKEHTETPGVWGEMRTKSPGHDQATTEKR